MPKESPVIKSARKALFHAAQSGDHLFIEKAPIEDIRIITQPASKDTILHVAARHGHLNVAKSILEVRQLKHILTSANQDGKCALHEAVQALHCSVAQYLIDQGTAVDVLKRADWTPLMLACTRDENSEMISLLLQNGADPELRNKDGWTAFHIATRKGNLNALRLLSSVDDSLWDTWSNNGRCPLHTAAIHGHLHMIECFLENTALPVDAADSCGSTPLMDAVRSGSIECCEYLFEKNASEQKRDKVGKNVLHVAAQAGCSSEIVDLLLSHGIDINCLTDNGQSVLHLAARENHVKTFKHFLTRGADLSIKDHSGSTAQDISRKNNSKDIMDQFNEENLCSN